jgi:hypothetical protein
MIIKRSADGDIRVEIPPEGVGMSEASAPFVEGTGTLIDLGAYEGDMAAIETEAARVEASADPDDMAKVIRRPE